MASLQRSKSDVPENRPSLARRAVAGVVLAAVVAIALFLVVHVIEAIFLFVLVIAVVGAVLWALKTIVW
jgi:fatty acid desaturase